MTDHCHFPAGKTRLDKVSDKGRPKRALVLTPNYPTLEINLGVVLGAMNRASEAESHFKRAIQLNPVDAKGYWFYGRWLIQMGRLPEAIVHLKIVVEKNPALTDPRHLLRQAYAAQSSPVLQFAPSNH